MSNGYLVTGGAGFIGSHLVRRLVADGASVRVVDNLSTGSFARLDEVIDSVDFLRGDLVEEGVCEEAVKGVDYVFHQAAVPSVQRSVLEPIATNRANVTATLNLLEACRRAKTTRLVYAASSSAYGDTEILPKTETMTADPLSPYALQKWIGERYCKLYYDLYGLETVSLRYFNVFGPDQDPDSPYSAVIPRFTRALLADEVITVYGDGEQSRDFTYVDNVVAANLLALYARNAPGRVFNIGCGERITLNKLITELESIAARKAIVTYTAPKPGDVRHSLADIHLARATLGYSPSVSFEDGLEKTVNWMQRILMERRSLS